MYTVYLRANTVNGMKYVGQTGDFKTRNKIGRIHKDKIITEEHKKRISQKLGKSVLQIDKNTNEVIAEFPSTREVEKQLGYVHNCISACCRGKQRTAYGYKWSFKN